MLSPCSFTVHRSLKDIPELCYVGYYWLSDQNKAEPVDDAKVDFSCFERNGRPINPFIVEANLFSMGTGVSVSVSHLDNEYQVTVIDWLKGPDAEVLEHTFIGHRSLGGKRLCFREAWIPVPDNLCEGFSVLTPTIVGFIGFAEEGLNV